MNSEVTPLTLEASFRHCEQLARQSGSNFYFAFLSLPRPMFRDICALYAFMRRTDDMGDDESLSLDQRRSQLQKWSEELGQCLQGKPSGQIFPALGDVIERHQIPEEYLRAVIDGVESDLSPRQFQTFADLEVYCYQVAGAVGLCCLRIWGCPETAVSNEQGVACGLAFQLINILRDLKEDAERNRLYLPVDELQQFGLNPDTLSHSPLSDNFQKFMQHQVQRAWTNLESAVPLLTTLPPPGRRILSAMLTIYGTLLNKIEAANYDVFSQRITLSRWQKVSISTRCLLRVSCPIPVRINAPQPQDS